MFIHTLKAEVLGDLTSKWGAVSSRPPSHDVYILKVDQSLRAWRDHKNKVKRN